MLAGKWQLGMGCVVAATLSGCGGGEGPNVTQSEQKVSAANGVEASVNVQDMERVMALTVKATTEITLESFDQLTQADGSAVPGWQFWNGGEFAGATGSFTVQGQGQASRYAALGFDFNCGSSLPRASAGLSCGKYVESKSLLTQAQAISDVANTSVFVRYRQGSALQGTRMRLGDASGQTLQYQLPRTSLERMAGASWTEALVPLNSVVAYWGGANNGRVNTALKSLSVLATQEDLVAAPSKHEFDHLALRTGNTAGLVLSGTEPVLNTGVVASIGKRVSVTALYHQLNDTLIRQIVDAGFGAVRLDVFWSDVEKNGTFDFSVYDALLRKLNAAGLEAILVLSYGHPDHGVGAPVAAADRAAFVRYAKELTALVRGRNVQFMEVWNEPDNAKFWGGTPEQYGQLLKETVAGIKSVDSTRKVSSGGMSWMNSGYINALAATGALKDLDGVAVHPYRNGLAPESLASDLDAVRQVLKARGVTAPVVATEWGYTSYGDIDSAKYGNGTDARAREWQAQMSVRALLTQVALNLPVFNFYQLKDVQSLATDSEQNFGLLDAWGVAKPSYAGLKLALTQIAGATYQGMVSGAPVGSHAIRWRTSDGKSLHAVWVDEPSTTLTLTFPATASITRWNGAAHPSTTYSLVKSTTVTQASGPVWIRF